MTAFYDHVVGPIQFSEYADFFCSPVFIPASRSFFANLQKNIFTFIASNIEIDPYLKEFGSLYETSKKWYKDSILPDRVKDRNLLNQINKSVEAIIAGDYEYHDDQDWIVSKGGKRTNLANASSGQQEALPMLLTLCTWPIIRQKEAGNMCFIEEPEAHLFPTSQGYIVSILSLFYREMGTNFFITTHSPYIISALNNFILAGDKAEANLITDKEFSKINHGGMSIRFEDVSAYAVRNGEAVSISDSEYRLIGAEMLDKISEHFEDVMNKMMTLG